MAGRPPRWGAVAFALVVALAGGIVVLVQHFLRDPSSAVDARSAGRATEDPNESAGATARGETPPHPDASAIPTPTVTAVEPRLEWPDEESLRRLERSGRALFGGIVRAPGGTPCEGATVWFDGEVVATTDDRGAWRADVSCIRVQDDEEFQLQRDGHWLESRKERVGYAGVWVELPSRRIDLDLATGLAFSGTVVDFDDGRPIGGAELEMRFDSYEDHVAKYKTRADDLGRFAFTNLKEGSVYVRGRAPGYDSNGFVGYDFSKGRDVVVAYRLRKEFTLRGRFVPWPVAGVATQRASLRATTRSPHDRRNTKLEFGGPIGPDGRFELAAPVCPTCVLELLVDDQPFWSDEFDTNEERREFDVGDIPLLPSATLIGRFDAPDVETRGRIVVVASISTPDGKHVGVHGRLDAAGTFRFAPLPPGGASVTFSLGSTEIANLENASGLDGDERACRIVTLLAGTTRDVGVVATQERVFYGTVRDPDGMPVAWANLDERVHYDEWNWASLFSARTDADGRFVGLRDVSSADESHAREFAGRARWEVSVEGRVSREFEFECPASDHWVRRDFVLETGVVLRGTLVDEAGAPFQAASILVLAGEGAGTSAGSDTTRADGSFEIRGLAASACRVLAFGRHSTFQFEDVHPESGPVTLRCADAVKK